ncbi:MAG: 3-deoxy-D-manno-octulosonic acid transferase [Marivibrio sp.]|uniref:3-deoxy-D-manno-octulosonic acid transferase n=1 Tax=Marivibrio sp. TaxID=2039719 RepID=UPI0032EAF3FB
MIWRGLYRSALAASRPALSLYLKRRLARGKEDPKRFPERLGHASIERPTGPLVWIHAASNGEAMSAQPLMEALAARDPDASILLTTGTVTSARLMASRLPTNAVHQYAPIDQLGPVRRFLANWRPDAGVWLESELWPNLLWEMRDDGRPTLLINGRISERSFQRWRRTPGLARDLLGGFDLCLAQTPREAERLNRLGARDADCVGNLKFSAPPLPVNADLLAALRHAVGARPLWVAASTHAGEEEIVADVHARLAPQRDGLLTILAPRHPVRGDAVAEHLRGQGFRVARRSETPTPPPDAEIYLADTLGELGLFYRLSEIALIGGSLIGGVGGHNPVEAVHLGAAPLFGPDMANFETVADELLQAGGARRIESAQEAAAAVAALLDDSDARRAMSAAAADVAARNRGVAQRVMQRLEPFLPPVSKPVKRAETS